MCDRHHKMSIYYQMPRMNTFAGILRALRVNAALLSTGIE